VVRSGSTCPRTYADQQRAMAMLMHGRRMEPDPLTLQSCTSRKRAFGLDPLVPASIWAGTKGPATSPQNGLDARDALVPARKDPLVPV
jgi:hypothetical protein